jgi:hypothetical protein
MKRQKEDVEAEKIIKERGQLRLEMTNLYEDIAGDLNTTPPSENIKQTLEADLNSPSATDPHKPEWNLLDKINKS